MSKTSEELGRYLNQRFEEMNREEGRSYSSPLTWREIAQRTNIPENSLIRWKEGVNPPTSSEHIAALANEFGYEVLVILGLIDQDTAFFLDHMNNPGVRQVFREAKKKAKNILAGEQAKAYSLESS
jgi:hypothetical protein